MTAWPALYQGTFFWNGLFFMERVVANYVRSCNVFVYSKRTNRSLPFFILVLYLDSRGCAYVCVCVKEDIVGGCCNTIWLHLFCHDLPLDSYLHARAR